MRDLRAWRSAQRPAVPINLLRARELQARL
jgi:hypothetical protein